MRHRVEPRVLSKGQLRAIRRAKPKGQTLRVRQSPKPTKAQKKALRKATNRFRYANNGSDTRGRK